MLTPEQIAARRQGIGGSDAAAVVGLSPWKTSWDVWLEKTGQTVLLPGEMTEPQLWGHVLERPIALEYARREGVELEFPDDTFQHPLFPFLRGHIDGRWKGGGVGLEVKTAGSWEAKKWGPSGKGPIPPQYLIQVVHYMGILGYERWDVAALIGGQDFRIYRIHRDQALESSLFARLQAFWNCVESMEPPPVDGSDGCFAYLKEQRPRGRKEKREATSEEDALARKLRGIESKIKNSEQEREELRARLAAGFGKKAPGIRGEWGSFGWTKSGQLRANWRK